MLDEKAEEKKEQGTMRVRFESRHLQVICKKCKKRKYTFDGTHCKECEGVEPERKDSKEFLSKTNPKTLPKTEKDPTTRATDIKVERKKRSIVDCTCILLCILHQILHTLMLDCH